MASWVLVPCLVQLRAEFNRIAPNRSTRSDGTIGDDAHQASTSDHNDDEVGRVPIKDADSKHEVHAFDATAELRESDLTMEKVVQHILGRCRAGVENRLRYIIFNRRIWEASNAWKQRAYTGSSPHTEHAHFSASYVTGREADTRSWRLEDIPVALTDADKKWLAGQIDASAQKAVAAANAVPAKVWATEGDVNVGYKATNADGSDRPPSMQKAIDILRHGSPEHHELEDLVRRALDELEALRELIDAGTP